MEQKEKIEQILQNLWKEDDGGYSEHRIYYNKALQDVQMAIDELKDVELYGKYKKDSLIAKACEFIKNTLEDVEVLDEYRGTMVRGIQKNYFTVDEFIEVFKMAMKE